MSRLLAAAVAILAVVGVAACGPDDSGPDLSRFAAVSPEVPPAAGR